MKKLLFLGMGFLLGIGALVAYAYPITPGYGGGTGFGAVSSTAVGNCLIVSSSTPSLLWTTGTCGTGGGGSSTIISTGNPFLIVQQVGSNATITPVSVLSLASNTSISFSSATGTGITATFLNPQGFISSTAGNWTGTWQGVNSTTFYLASNPQGYGSSTLIFAGSYIGVAASGTNGYIISNTGVTSTAGNWGGTWQLYNPSDFKASSSVSGGSVSTSSAITSNYFPFWGNSTGGLSGTSTIFQSSTGNIGIGTTNPQKLFTVSGNQTGGIMRVQRTIGAISPSGVYGTYDISMEADTSTIPANSGVALTFSVATSTSNSPTTLAGVEGVMDALGGGDIWLVPYSSTGTVVVAEQILPTGKILMSNNLNVSGTFSQAGVSVGTAAFNATTDFVASSTSIVNTVNGASGAITVVTSTGANPTATISTSTQNGSANTFMRSDAAPALSQTLGYTFSALGNTTSTANISAATLNVSTTAQINGTTTIGTGTSTLVFLGNVGHWDASGTAPALTSCGGTPSITGSDYAGRVVAGSAATGCTITFVNAYVNTPACTVTNQSLGVTNTFTYTVSNSAIAVSQTGLAGDIVDYVCIAMDE